MAFCPHCGTRLGDENTKCAACGTETQTPTASRFKGTVMMTPGPSVLPQPGHAQAAATTSAPAAPGSPNHAAPAGAPPAGRPGPKPRTTPHRTVLGGMSAPIASPAQHAAGASGQSVTAASARGPAAATPKPPAGKSAKPPLKSTIVGGMSVAPPRASQHSGPPRSSQAQADTYVAGASLQPQNTGASLQPKSAGPDSRPQAPPVGYNTMPRPSITQRPGPHPTSAPAPRPLPAASQPTPVSQPEPRATPATSAPSPAPDQFSATAPAHMLDAGPISQNLPYPPPTDDSQAGPALHLNDPMAAYHRSEYGRDTEAAPPARTTTAAGLLWLFIGFAGMLAVAGAAVLVAQMMGML